MMLSTQFFVWVATIFSSILLGGLITFFLSPTIAGNFITWILKGFLSRSSTKTRLGMVLDIRIVKADFQNFALRGVRVGMKNGSFLNVDVIQVKCILYKLLFRKLDRKNPVEILIENVRLSFVLDELRELVEYKKTSATKENHYSKPAIQRKTRPAHSLLFQKIFFCFHFNMSNFSVDIRDQYDVKHQRDYCLRCLIGKTLWAADDCADKKWRNNLVLNNVVVLQASGQQQAVSIPHIQLTSEVSPTDIFTAREKVSLKAITFNCNESISLRIDLCFVNHIKNIFLNLIPNTTIDGKSSATLPANLAIKNKSKLQPAFPSRVVISLDSFDLQVYGNHITYNYFEGVNNIVADAKSTQKSKSWPLLKVQLASLESTLLSTNVTSHCELSLAQVLIETGASLEYQLSHISSSFTYGQISLHSSKSIGLDFQVKKVEFRDMRQYATSGSYSNIYMQDFETSVLSIESSEIDSGESDNKTNSTYTKVVPTHHISRPSYEVSSSSKEMFCQLFPAVAESICEDIVSLKLFVIECIPKTAATVEPRKVALSTKDVPEGDAMVFVCHVSFQNCLLEVYVDENTCFFAKSPLLSLKLPKYCKDNDSTVISAKCNAVFLCVVHEDIKYDVGTISDFEATFERFSRFFLQQENNLNIPRAIVSCKVDSLKISFPNNLQLGTVISLFLNQLKGVIARTKELSSCLKVSAQSEADKIDSLSSKREQSASEEKKINGVSVEMTFNDLHVDFEDEDTLLENEYADISRARGTKKHPVFDLAMENVMLQWNTKGFDDRKMIETLVECDSCHNPPLDHGFIDMYGAKINFEIAEIHTRIRNFNHNLFEVKNVKLLGKVVLAVLQRTLWCSWHKHILLAGGTEREPVDVCVASTPMKQYFNIRGLADYTSIAWGPCLNFGISAFSRAIGRFLPKSVDGSPPLKFWDLYRYMFHGPIKFETKVLKYIAYGPGTNSSKDDYAQLVINRCKIHLHKRSRIDIYGDNGTINRMKMPTGESEKVCTMGRPLVQMNGIKFSIKYTWDVPSGSEHFDHYVQLHEQRVKLLRQGKQLRDIFAAFRSVGLAINLELITSSATVQVEWHKHLKWYMNVYNLILAPPEQFWTQEPRSEPTIGYLMKRYTFNMELGDFCLAINDKSVGIGVCPGNEPGDSTILATCFELAFASNYPALSFDPGIMESFSIDLKQAVFYFCGSGSLRKVVKSKVVPAMVPIIEISDLGWTSNNNMDIPMHAICKEGKLFWTVNNRDIVIELIRCLSTVPGEAPELGADGEDLTTGTKDNENIYRTNETKTAVSPETVESSGNNQQMKNPSPALSNDKNGTGLTQKIKKINVKSNAKDVETGEFNEMSLLDFLSEKNQRSNSVDQTIADHHESSRVNNSSSFAVNTTRRTRSSSTTNSYGQNSFKRSRSGSFPWKGTTSLGDEDTSEEQHLNFTIDYKITLLQLQVYFQDELTKAGMLVTSPNVCLTGRHLFEPDVNEMAGNRVDENSELERMDELYTETGKLECFIAPAEIANGQEPWLEQNLTTPKDGIESADRNNTHKVSQNFVERRFSSSTSIYNRTISSPGLEIAQRSFTNYAPHVYIQMAVINLTTNSPEFYQIIDVIRHVLLAPPKSYKDDARWVGNKTNKTVLGETDGKTRDEKVTTNMSKDEDQICSDVDSEDDSPPTIDIEHLLNEITRQMSTDSCAESAVCEGILSELSYSFEGIGWHLQPLNEDPPIEIGINGIQGKHVFYEDTSTSVNIGIKTLYIVDMKPCALAAINFEDSTMVLKPFLLDRKQQTEHFLEIKCVTSPILEVHGKSISVYDNFEISIFPGSRYVLCVQLTHIIASSLSNFFFGETESTTDATDINDTALFFGETVDVVENRSIKSKEVIAADEDENEVSGSNDNFVFFKRVRMGEIAIKISLQGYVKTLNGFSINVAPYSRTSRLTTWQKLASSVINHIKWSVIGRGGEVAYKTITFQSTSINNRSGLTLHTSDVDDEEEALLSLLGGGRRR